MFEWDKAQREQGERGKALKVRPMAFRPCYQFSPLGEYIPGVVIGWFGYHFSRIIDLILHNETVLITMDNCCTF